MILLDKDWRGGNSRTMWSNKLVQGLYWALKVTNHLLILWHFALETVKESVLKFYTLQCQTDNSSVHKFHGLTSAVNLVIAVLSTRWGHWEEQSRGFLEQNIRTQQLCQYVCSYQAAYRRIFRTISGWFEANSNNYFLWIGLHVFQISGPCKSELFWPLEL